MPPQGTSRAPPCLTQPVTDTRCREGDPMQHSSPRRPAARRTAGAADRARVAKYTRNAPTQWSSAPIRIAGQSHLTPTCATALQCRERARCVPVRVVIKGNSRGSRTAPHPEPPTWNPSRTPSASPVCDPDGTRSRVPEFAATGEQEGAWRVLAATCQRPAATKVTRP
jgi:hypothetical protein